MPVSSLRADCWAECITAAELCKALVFVRRQSFRHGISAMAFDDTTLRAANEFAAGCTFGVQCCEESSEFPLEDAGQFRAVICGIDDFRKKMLVNL